MLVFRYTHACTGAEVDKALITSVSLSATTELDSGDALTFLRGLLADVSPQTQALLQQAPLMIDLPPALPGADSPR